MLKLNKEGLLQTIYVPKNLASLSAQLPKQNYNAASNSSKKPIDSQYSGEPATALINMKGMSQHQSQKIISQDNKVIDEVKSPALLKATEHRNPKKLTHKKTDNYGDVSSPTN